ncbi:hypothetical protein Pelo_351 [Pelomyxa schiedti]|nr:hypothetical protein Pelo_351 [Pelomyxa schiedti]
MGRHTTDEPRAPLLTLSPIPVVACPAPVVSILTDPGRILPMGFNIRYWVHSMGAALWKSSSDGDNNDRIDASPPSPVKVDTRTSARMQFIALAVGPIVGRRRGRTRPPVAAPVSCLTAPLLALIGRDWVVFPSRRVLFLLRVYSDETKSRNILFSVSPTLGLVDYPAVVDFGSAEHHFGSAEHHFGGWVGPAVDYYHRRGSRRGGKSRRVILGCRFALLHLLARSDDGFNFDVIDMMNGHIIASVRDPSLSLLRSETWEQNRRWGVLMIAGRNERPPSMSLWNFDEVGGGSPNGGVRHSEDMPLPWAPGTFDTAFDGDSFVFRVRRGVDFEVIVVDLEATWEQGHVVVKSQVPGPVLVNDFERMWCWRGMVYMTGFAGLCCTTTGETTAFHKHRSVCPIGGPYFLSESPKSPGLELYSVVEPTKLCFRHERGAFEQELVQELVVRRSVPGAIEVIDAVSGSSIFTMTSACHFNSVDVW